MTAVVGSQDGRAAQLPAGRGLTPRMVAAEAAEAARRAGL
ncbi:hypothetical protein [Thermocrispum sp.]